MKLINENFEEKQGLNRIDSLKYFQNNKYIQFESVRLARKFSLKFSVTNGEELSNKDKEIIIASFNEIKTLLEGTKLELNDKSEKDVNVNISELNEENSISISFNNRDFGTETLFIIVNLIKSMSYVLITKFDFVDTTFLLISDKTKSNIEKQDDYKADQQEATEQAKKERNDKIIQAKDWINRTIPEKEMIKWKVDTSSDYFSEDIVDTGFGAVFSFALSNKNFAPKILPDWMQDTINKSIKTLNKKVKSIGLKVKKINTIKFFSEGYLEVKIDNEELFKKNAQSLAINNKILVALFIDILEKNSNFEYFDLKPIKYFEKRWDTIYSYFENVDTGSEEFETYCEENFPHWDYELTTKKVSYKRLKTKTKSKLINTDLSNLIN